jgi:hypothetical protein
MSKDEAFFSTNALHCEKKITKYWLIFYRFKSTFYLIVIPKCYLCIKNDYGTMGNRF